MDLRPDRAVQRGLIGRDVTEGVRPVEERIDDLPLVMRCSGAGERVEEAREVRRRVVAEEARAIPDGPRGECVALVDEDGVALVAKALGTDEVGDGQHHLVAAIERREGGGRVFARDGDAGEVLAVVAADDTGDAVVTRR